jgi:hypothetical protein
MSDQPNFGPSHRMVSVRAFDEISDRVSVAATRHIDEEWGRFARPVDHLFIRMGYQAKCTSLALRVANSWLLTAPAIALLRVRLEQTIVCSYLRWESEEIGLRPFVVHLDIDKHIKLGHAMQHPAIREDLGRQFDLTATEKAPRAAQVQLTPGFDVDHDHLQRSWTKLDLLSMAKRRDVLAAGSRLSGRVPLAPQYDTFYRVASSVVHSDVTSVSTAFLDLFAGPDGGAVLMSPPSWAPVIAGLAALCDILQHYEILSRVGLSIDTDFDHFWEEWRSAGEDTSGRSSVR